VLKNNKETENNLAANGKTSTRLKNEAAKNSNTRRLVLCALFVALGVILGGLLSIPAMPLGVYSLKIGFGTLPVILSGVLFGPVYGGIVGGLTDFLQAVTFSKGAYMPWFTITGILFGFIPGLFFIKKQKPTFVRILLAVFAGQTVGSVLLNTWLIATINALPFWATLTARAINQAVMIPVYTVLVYYIIRALSRMKVIE